MKTKSFKILYQYFLRFYRSIMSKNGKRRKHTIVDKNDILECQSLIWKVIRDRYLEDEGGVYINNIGYLCHKINPNRKIYLNKLTGTINRRGTGGYSYVHTCIDFMPRNKYFHLYISPALNRECRLAMESGRRYKFLYREVESESKVFGVKWVYKL